MRNTKSMREQLRDIEDYSYKMSVQMVGFVRDNYMSVIERKDKEIEALKQRIEELEGGAS